MGIKTGEYYFDGLFRSDFPPEPLAKRLFSAKISSAAADEIFGIVQGRRL
jgi:hypothetical protein